MNDYPPFSLLEDQARLPPSDRYAATIVTRIIDRYLDPQSVLDIGCGNGVWLDVLRDGGRRYVQGIGEDAYALHDLAIDPAQILIASLDRPLTLNRTFDLVVCLEGPDQVEPRFAEVLVNNCVRHADAVLFSTVLSDDADPTAGLADSSDWAAAFHRHGFVDVDLIRPLIWHDPRIPFWQRQGLRLFLKHDLPRLPILQAEAARAIDFSPLTQTKSAWPYAVSFAAELDGRRGDELIGRLAWQADQLNRALAGEQASRDEVLLLARDLEQVRRSAATARGERDTLQDHIDKLGAHIEALQRHMAATDAELERAQSTVAVLRQERAIILDSTIWRATGPLRAFGRALPLPLRLRLRQVLRGGLRLGRVVTGLRFRRQVRGRKPATATQTNSDGDPTPVVETGRRVVIISGESHTPGHFYRVLRLAEAAESCGVAVSWMRLEDSEHRRDEISRANVVFIWRAPFTTATSAIVRTAREAGAKIVFDVDDLMVKPELARIDIIDGIRSMRVSADETARLFARVQKLMLQADVCTCPTNELADHIREYQKIAYVLPNGFDEAVHRTSRLAVRRRRREPDTALIRIGYASGTRTHQRDFGQASDALARVLREHPECRLVLFRDPLSQEPVVHPTEFPVLAACMHQIEWRDMVPLDRLPNEIARFDINLIPLEIGNPFCEAKSELKFFEAALVEVCTIASRTGPMQRTIRDWETGRLVDSPDSWYAALCDLIGDPNLRVRMAHAAYLDVLWRYGPQRRAEQFQSLLDQIDGGATGARAFEVELRRATRPSPAFDIAASNVVYAADQGGEAAVSVVIPLYNYAHYIQEALESVRMQTLPLLDLVVVDDGSTDASLQVTVDWATRHASRFNRIVVLRNRENAGLGRTRNAGFDAAETPFVLPLDADNRLLPDCCASLLRALDGSRSGFAYPRIRSFGDSNKMFGDEPFSAMRFAGGNYIDAMALVGKWAWAAVGGYEHIPHGWEDYDFWCRFVENGFWGIPVAEVLAEYRVHNQSMLRTSTDQHENKLKLIRDLNRRHDWLSIPYRA